MYRHLTLLFDSMKLLPIKQHLVRN